MSMADESPTVESKRIFDCQRLFFDNIAKMHGQRFVEGQPFESMADDESSSVAEWKPRAGRRRTRQPNVLKAISGHRQSDHLASVSPLLLGQTGECKADRMAVKLAKTIQPVVNGYHPPILDPSSRSNRRPAGRRYRCWPKLPTANQSFNDFYKHPPVHRPRPLQIPGLARIEQLANDDLQAVRLHKAIEPQFVICIDRIYLAGSLQ